MCLIPLFFRDQRISCGKCPECLRAQRADWAYRCEQESLVHKFNYFFTLTFNDRFLPPDEKGVWDCFTAFRKAFWADRGKFSYFVSMERGDLHGRLHLHMLLYSDKPVPKDFVRRLWFYGFIKRSSITKKRVRYCLSYMFDPDPFNKIKMYRSSNHFGGSPSLPYRIRCVRGRPTFVPLPRYYTKINPAAKSFARSYYNSIYHCNDFDSVYLKCKYRFERLRFGYGKKRLVMSYDDYLFHFIGSRVRYYPTFKDPRDLIAFPGPDKYRGLNRCYSLLLARVKNIVFHGDRASGNLERYLTIDCPMSLREAQCKKNERLRRRKRPPNYIYFRDFYNFQLTLF